LATHEPAAVRRAQILEAALACFGENGLHASKMDDIARASGLSKGAIYWHFKSKEEIFLALFDQFEQELFRDWERLDAEDGTAPLETLRRVAELTLSRILETRLLLDAWTEFLRHPKSRTRMAAVYRQSRERLAATVQRGVDAGEIRPCNPEHIAATLTGLVEGLLLQAFTDPSYDPLGAWPTAWDAIARGLTSSSGTGSAGA
jgi:AcrR family transcriptional regulator